MLKVIGIVDAPNLAVEVNPYIPISYGYERGRTFPAPYYWRSGDLKQSLIEIGLNRFNDQPVPPIGTIIDITLVNLPLPTDLNYIAPNTILQGIPICDVSAWSGDSRFIEVKEHFLTVIKDTSVSIFFGLGRAPDKLYQAGQIGFGITDDEICSVEFFNLSYDNISEIRETLIRRSS